MTKPGNLGQLYKYKFTHSAVISVSLTDYYLNILNTNLFNYGKFNIQEESL